MGTPYMERIVPCIMKETAEILLYTKQSRLILLPSFVYVWHHCASVELYERRELALSVNVPVEGSRDTISKDMFGEDV